MGDATMLFPDLVLRHCIHARHHPTIFNGSGGSNPIPKLVMQCFGSQATLCGILILSTKWTSQSYKTFALCILPYFVFDGLAYTRGYLTALCAVGDAAGNIVFLACSWFGYHAEKSVERKLEE